MDIRHPLDDSLPALLRSGRTLRAIFNSLPSPALVEMCGYAGFDFVIIDNEHGSAGHDITENMLRAARAAVPLCVCCQACPLAACSGALNTSATQMPRPRLYCLTWAGNTASVLLALAAPKAKSAARRA